MSVIVELFFMALDYLLITVPILLVVSLVTAGILAVRDRFFRRRQNRDQAAKDPGAAVEGKKGSLQPVEPNTVIMEPTE